MCQYEELTFRCGHKVLRVCKYCHFARNDPLHQCMGSWSIKRRTTIPGEDCPTCVAEEAERQKSLVEVNEGANNGPSG